MRPLQSGIASPKKFQAKNECLLPGCKIISVKSYCCAEHKERHDESHRVMDIVEKLRANRINETCVEEAFRKLYPKKLRSVILPDTPRMKTFATAFNLYRIKRDLA